MERARLSAEELTDALSKGAGRPSLSADRPSYRNGVRGRPVRRLARRQALSLMHHHTEGNLSDILPRIGVLATRKHAGP